jgi:nucleoside-diphosphate kinase
MERTLAIIKPDAVQKKCAGRILARIEEEGFDVVALRMVRLTRGEAEGFYAVHRDKPFFESLTAFMSEGPAIVAVLERDDAIKHWRQTMGATNPENADEGTIRKLFATNIERNAVHGSDAPETAADEIGYFFGSIQLLTDR